MLARVSRVTLVFKEPPGAPEGPAVRGSGPPFPPRRSRSRSSLREGENRRGKPLVNALAFFRSGGGCRLRKCLWQRALWRPFLGLFRAGCAPGHPFRVAERHDMRAFGQVRGREPRRRGPREPLRSGADGLAARPVWGHFPEVFADLGLSAEAESPGSPPRKHRFSRPWRPSWWAPAPSPHGRTLLARAGLALARRPRGSVRARTGLRLRTCCSRATPPAPRKNAGFAGNYGVWARSRALGPAQGRGPRCRPLRAALAALCNAVRAWPTARRALRRQPAGSRTAARHPRCACGCSRR